MPWSDGMTREQFDTELAAARREGAQEADGLRAQLTTVNDEKAALITQVSQATRRQAAIQALLTAGVKPERLEKALKQLPDDADCSTPEKTKAVIDAVKAELPEWFAPAMPNGVGRSPSETLPATDLATLSMPDYIAARRKMGA